MLLETKETIRIETEELSLIDDKIERSFLDEGIVPPQREKPGILLY